MAYIPYEQCFKVGDWVTTNRKISSMKGYFEPGTKVQIIGTSMRGYDLRDSSGNEISEVGWNAISALPVSNLSNEETIRRKVLIADSLGDGILVLTDAPKSVLENWIRRYCESEANSPARPNELVDVSKGLRPDYYWRLLHDTTVDEDKDDIDYIGYSEYYDLNEYYPD